MRGIFNRCFVFCYLEDFVIICRNYYLMNKRGYHMNWLIKLLMIIFFSFIFDPSVNFAEEKQADSEKLTSEETYKLLYENSQEVNGKILDTIYWALGGMVTVILLFIGTNAYFNNKTSKSEIENLTNEYKRKLQDSANDIENKLEQNFNQFKDKLREDMNSNIQIFNTQQMDQINNYKDSFQIQLDAVGKQINSRVSDIEGVNNVQSNEIKESHKKLSEELTKKSNNLKYDYERRIKILNIEVLESNAEIAKLKGVPVNALRNYIRAGTVRLEVGFSLDYTFKWIIEMVKTIKNVEPDIRRELAVLLEKADDGFISVKEQINELLKDKP
jgi:hypothetical protein